VCAALAVAACGQVGDAPSASAPAPELMDPTPEAVDGHAFEPANDATRTATGQLDLSVTTRLPDAEHADNGSAANTEVIALRGQTGVIIEGELTGATQTTRAIDGAPLRALMGLAAAAADALVYRVTRAEGPNLCAGEAASHIVVWESNRPGDSALAILPVSGGAPGQAGAHACQALAYRRA
jgi:hypothetical protein